MNGPLTPAEYEQLQAELDNAEPLTPWHWGWIGAGTAAFLAMLLIGARTAGLV